MADESKSGANDASLPVALSPARAADSGQVTKTPDNQPAQDTTLLRNGFLFVVTIGMLAAAALAVDYTQVSPVFCDEVRSGCAAVKSSAYAKFFGIPTPFFGLMGFALLTLTALVRGARARLAFALVSGFGFCGGAFFLLTQLRMGQICKYCVLTDIAVILVAAIALHRYVKKWDWPESLKLRALCCAIPLIAGALVLVVGPRLPRSVPDPIARAEAELSGSQVLVLDFVDFECPFCRRMHENLKPLLDAHPGKFRVVRKHVPLAMHPFARGAARAAICAEKQGKGDAYAELLMVQPEDDLIEFAFEKLARKLELNEQNFRACVKDPETEARIERDRADYKTCEGSGLPMIYLGRERLFGLMETAELAPKVEALAR
jgi:uncharacterized membrane protein